MNNTRRIKEEKWWGVRNINDVSMIKYLDGGIFFFISLPTVI